MKDRDFGVVEFVGRIIGVGGVVLVSAASKSMFVLSLQRVIDR